MSTTPHVTADVPNVVWALDLQFGSTIDGTAVKIASMLDEPTRKSLRHLAERSITADPLVVELERVFDLRGGHTGGAAHGQRGWELISATLREFSVERVGLVYIPPRTTWNNGFIESFNDRVRRKRLNRAPGQRTRRGAGHRHSALAYRTPAEQLSPAHAARPMACDIV